MNSVASEPKIGFPMARHLGSLSTRQAAYQTRYQFVLLFESPITQIQTGTEPQGTGAFLMNESSKRKPAQAATCAGCGGQPRV